MTRYTNDGLSIPSVIIPWPKTLFVFEIALQLNVPLSYVSSLDRGEDPRPCSKYPIPPVRPYVFVTIPSKVDLHEICSGKYHSIPFPELWPVRTRVQRTKIFTNPGVQGQYRTGKRRHHPVLSLKRRPTISSNSRRKDVTKPTYWIVEKLKHGQFIELYDNSSLIPVNLDQDTNVVIRSWLIELMTS